jgi:choline dehydrogenase-like flavoprotein
MYVDARQIASGSELETDLCIVGAGAAGITIARELERCGCRICLVESGGLKFDEETNALYKGENIGLPYFALDCCQLRLFGGNTNAWGGWCRPLDPIDFEARPWVPNSGWPISAGDLTAYYAKAGQLCQLSRDSYAIEDWIDEIQKGGGELLRLDPARLETSLYQFSPPTRFGQAFREEIRRSSSIKCLLHATVVKIDTAWDMRRVTRISVKCLGGRSFGIRAKIYVLAAGGTENARLLLISREVAPNGIGNEHDLVGRFFMEHPHVLRRILPLSRRPPVLLYGLKLRAKGISARASLTSAVERDEGLLRFGANIHSIYRGHETPGWMALRKLVLSLSRSRRNDPYLRFAPYGRKRVDVHDLWRILRELPTAGIAALLQVWQPDRFIEGYALESKSEQAPNPDSRLTLRQECDALGVNRIQIAWRMSPLDRRTVVRGEEILGDELVRLGIGALAPLPEELVSAWPDNLQGGWHQLGTTRMHDDSQRGVVDANCRVHGMSNLFIAGGSVFPTAGATAPTLTIVALALRLANHLMQVFLADELSAVRPAPAKVPAVPEAALSAAGRLHGARLGLRAFVPVIRASRGPSRP